MPYQNKLISLCRHVVPNEQKYRCSSNSRGWLWMFLLMYLERYRASLTGEVPGPWSSHIDLTLRLSDNLVPTAVQEPNILKPRDSQMRMNRAALLAFQHSHRVIG
jgi:hypothetical protein